MKTFILHKRPGIYVILDLIASGRCEGGVGWGVHGQVGIGAI